MEQSLLGPNRLNGRSRGEPIRSDGGERSASGAEASSTGRRSSEVNLRRAIQVGTLNVLSLTSDTSAVCGATSTRHQRGCSTHRPETGEITVGGYIYSWSGRSDGYHSEGVAIAVVSRLVPMVAE